MSCLVINTFPKIETCSYLELGIGNRQNFNGILCKEKYSVDLNGSADFTGTTNEYFAQLDINKMFDIIFIDANHDYDYVLRDFNNAVEHANYWIILHDMIPPSELMTAHYYCSDSYKLLYYFLLEEKFTLFSTVENYGLTLVKMPAKKVYPDEKYRNISYTEFISYIDKHYKLYSEKELTQYFHTHKFI